MPITSSFFPWQEFVLKVADNGAKIIIIKKKGIGTLAQLSLLQLFNCQIVRLPIFEICELCESIFNEVAAVGGILYPFRIPSVQHVDQKSHEKSFDH